MTDIRIVGIAGSLREGSLNRALLRSAAELAPEGVTIEPFDLDDIPLYRAEADGDDRPEPVERLKDAIDAADGVLFATPEYNYGIPGVLKNAIDWASRPGFRSPLRDKPVAIVGATPSVVGTARTQQHLKLVLLGTASAVFPWPEFLLGQAKDRIEGGRVTDDETQRFLGEMLEGFAEWVKVVGRYAARRESAGR